MKKSFLALVGTVLTLVACQEKATPIYQATIQMMLDGANAAIEGISVTVTDGTTEYTALTDAQGQASVSVPAGLYDVTATGKTFVDGVRSAYNGTKSINVLASDTFTVDLSKSESSQIIIKELYNGGCQKNGNTGAFSNDKYIVLYNNSETEVDASNTVISFTAPYNSNATNKYITDGVLSYENEDWIPAYGAIWWFTSEVKIAPYSQIVIAVYQAVDETQTYSNSVNLSNADYYWMSNTEATQYKLNYAVSDNIPTTHYLSCSPFTMGTMWALSVASPALFIGRMDKATALALSQNSDAYDKTMGTTAAFYAVKFPKASVVDAIEVWSYANVAKSNYRFPASINSGYVALTATGQGYTLYRNVDKAATEALPENAGKLVYDYAGGTADIEGGSTDPSGIDAEASIKAGAHIIYSDTNNSSTDFHQRKVASIK